MEPFRKALFKVLEVIWLHAGGPRSEPNVLSVCPKDIAVCINCFPHRSELFALRSDFLPKHRFHDNSRKVY